MGITKPASVIDHCIPARCYDDFFNTDNLFPVCVQCHSDVTKNYDNRNAHEIFKENYQSIKYSGREFTYSLEDGFKVDAELDDLLLSLPIVRVNTPPTLENKE